MVLLWVESLHEDICPTDSDQIHANQSVSKNSQPTRTIGSVASNIIDSESESEIDPKEILIRKCLEMIRISDAEEGSRYTI
jgi:hypothetical protein